VFAPKMNLLANELPYPRGISFLITKQARIICNVSSQA
jgi:alpha-D-ribose 1-methylphosphonate 5-triphosphate synthase subunit PhnH